MTDLPALDFSAASVWFRPYNGQRPSLCVRVVYECVCGNVYEVVANARYWGRLALATSFGCGCGASIPTPNDVFDQLAPFDENRVRVS